MEVQGKHQAACIVRWLMDSNRRFARFPRARRPIDMIFTSPYQAVPIPDGKTIWNMLEHHARERGDKPAFVCGITDQVLTFAELLKRAAALAAGLAARGIKRGDVRVAALVENEFRCLTCRARCRSSSCTRSTASTTPWCSSRSTAWARSAPRQRRC